MGVLVDARRPRLASHCCLDTRRGYEFRLSSSQGRLLLQARKRVGKGACAIIITIVSQPVSYILSQINAFYLQKEAELKLRLETLLSKRRAAALRTLPEATDNLATDHVEWSAVEEGFRLLERDLAKLLVRKGFHKNTCMDVNPLPAIHRTQRDRIQENPEEMG